MPAAVELIMLIKKKTEIIPESGLNDLEKDVFKELQLFGLIGSLLCSIFYETKISLIDQLIKLSQLAHIMLVVFRRHRTQFITNNLYTDIQSTIQDAFVSAAIFHENSSNSNLYLFMRGTDQLENLYSTVRTITHAKNCDFLELTERLIMALQIEKVRYFIFYYVYFQISYNFFGLVGIF